MRRNNNWWTWLGLGLLPATVLAGLWVLPKLGMGQLVGAAPAERKVKDAASGPKTKRPAPKPQDRWAAKRDDMVRRQLASRDITDQSVLAAMRRVPRHRFVPPEIEDLAYADAALPIGRGQTISQPYMVALMTQLARPHAQSKALDVGTGSGYQAAVLAELCKEVHSVEIVKSLADDARKRLAALGYENVVVRHGDGYQGDKQHAPFDLIIVAAAPDHVPDPLIEQLAPGGRLVIPVGDYYQDLLVIEKQADGSVRRMHSVPVLFVPMTGEAQRRPR